MKKPRRWMSGAMSLTLRWCGKGVMELDYSGIITRAGVLAFYDAVPGTLPADLLAVVVRFDRATIAGDETTLMTGYHTSENGRRMHMPGAVICRHDQLPMLLRHADQVAALGATRVPFTDAEQAFAWVFRRAKAARLAMAQ